MKQNEASCGTDESKKQVRMDGDRSTQLFDWKSMWFLCNLEMPTSLLCFPLLAYLRWFLLFCGV